MNGAPRLARLGTRAPDYREQGERWSVIPVEDCDDGPVAAAGWNVIGPVLDLGALGAEADELVALLTRPKGSLDGDERSRLAELLSRTPRRTAPAYDIDALDLPDSGLTAATIARRILEKERDLGVVLRASYSSGIPGRGIHLELGPATPEACSPDLPRRMMWRSAAIAGLAGLVPRSGTRYHGGIALSWVLPEHAAEPEPPAFLDLNPLNKDPESRGGIFRPLGGLNKRGTARKCPIPGSAPEGSPTTPELLAMGNVWGGAAQPTRSAAARPSKYVAPIAVASDIAPLVEMLRPLRRRGEHHDLRMALSHLAQTKGLLDRATWVRALGSAWGDEADAAAAWDSTAQRIKGGGLCKGAGFLRRHLGVAVISAMAHAVAVVAKVPYALLVARFGRPPVEARHLDVLEPHLDTLEDAEGLKERVCPARHCRKFDHGCQCARCERLLYPKSPMPCRWFELCRACMVEHIQRLDAYCRKRWTAKRVVTVTLKGFANREDVFNLLEKANRDVPLGQRCLAIPIPQRDGTWDFLLLCDEKQSGAAFLRGLMGRDGNDGRIRSRNSALNLMAWALEQRSVTVLDLLERNEGAKAAALVQELYRTHRAYGTKGSGLCFPSRAAIQKAAKEERANDEEFDSGCPCPAEAGEKHSYTHRATGRVVIQGVAYPASLVEVAKQYEAGQRAGFIPIEHKPVEHHIPLRL